MALLDDVKTSLRISHNKLDNEINYLIDAARYDLIIAGVSEEKVKSDGKNEDPLIKRAIIVYCKANFGLDDKDTVAAKEMYQRSYESIKQHLSLSGDYRV